MLRAKVFLRIYNLNYSQLKNLLVKTYALLSRLLDDSLALTIFNKISKTKKMSTFSLIMQAK